MTASASTLLLTAQSYHSAMKRLVLEFDTPGNHHLGAPYALLEGFALECAFKAVACICGASSEDLRKLGHDLILAQTAALKCGLQLSDFEGVSRVVNTMQEPHKAMLVRYIPANRESIILPDPIRALSVIEKLLDDISSQFPAIVL